ncbi:MAG: hypothetical protein IKU45_05710, partial [Clostridia bacterium]|nr:hypothetical protein [Clostridia bacterium]
MNNNYTSKVGIVFDVLVYGLFAIILSVLQTTLVPRMPIYDATPDIIIGAIAFLGIYRGEKTAALFGLFAGLCVDGLSSVGVSFLPLFYCIGGFVCGSIGKAAKENARFAAFLVTIPTFSFFRTFITFVKHLVDYENTLEYAYYGLHVALPEFVSTLVLCIPVLFIGLAFDSPLQYARKKGWLY